MSMLFPGVERITHAQINQLPCFPRNSSTCNEDCKGYEYISPGRRDFSSHKKIGPCRQSHGAGKGRCTAKRSHAYFK